MDGTSLDDFADALRQAREGDAAAWGELLERYRAYLTLLAEMQLERRLRGKVAAADVVQEVYLRAVRFGPGFNGGSEGELLAWLRTILASRLAEEARRYGTQARDVRLERALAAELEHSSRQLAAGLAAPGPAPGSEAARRELGVVVADALAELPEHYRRAVVLRHLEGLGIEAIMARTDWTRDQALKYIQRGLARLAQKLGGLA